MNPIIGSQSVPSLLGTMDAVHPQAGNDGEDGNPFLGILAALAAPLPAPLAAVAPFSSTPAMPLADESNGPGFPTPQEEQAGGVSLLVRRAADGQVSGLDLEMRHAELGNVQVRLAATGEGLTAHLLVASVAAQEVVEGQLHHLRQRLANAGLSNMRVSVSDHGSVRRQPVEPRSDRSRYQVPGRARSELQRLDVVA